MSILFSCMGTSDPVRGYRDGPLLHILRHYRPEKICVFLSDEAARLDIADARLDKVSAYIREHWAGYSPDIEPIITDITDPSDLDAVSGPISEAVLKLCNQYPDDKILLNLSSGTPQMGTVLSFLATDTRFNITGIQVKNPEGAAGSTERTNTPNYSVKDELECNEDEAPDAENRCREPKLMHVQRQKEKEQIIALLGRRDYGAIYTLRNRMPDRMKALVGHLDARDKMQDDTARKRAQNLKLPFPLYPAKSGAPRSDYPEVSEAYLVLLNRCHRKQYEELVLRLNPLIVRLELRLLKNALSGMGKRLESVIKNPYSNRPRFVPEMLANSLPEVYEKIRASSSAPLWEGDINMELCYRILENLPDVPADALELIENCNNLNNSCRNELAHQLTAVTSGQIKAACGMEAEQLMKRVGGLIASLYPECDTRLFTIYKDCGNFIKKNLF